MESIDIHSLEISVQTTRRYIHMGYYRMLVTELVMGRYIQVGCFNQGGVIPQCLRYTLRRNTVHDYPQLTSVGTFTCKSMSACAGAQEKINSVLVRSITLG